MRWLLITLLVAGCQSPPSGGFRCSAADQACPGSLHCSCGLCVEHDNEAACTFDVQVDADTVKEHQPFDVSITARAADGTPATGFHGTVDLSFRLPDGSRWADVRPATLALPGGSATTTVTINRETIPPQAPRLTVQFAGQSGASDGIHVVAPRFVKDATPIVTMNARGTNVSTVQVVFDGTQFRMYYAGNGSDMKSKVGLALSPDGKNFTIANDTVFPGPGSIFPSNAIIVSAAPYQSAGSWNLAFYAQSSTGTTLDIGQASSPDGLGVFSLSNGGNPILTHASCGTYCNNTAWFPSVLQPATGEWLMFFSAMRCNAADGNCLGFFNVSMSVGRADSTDGSHFQPQPAPVLSGDAGGEQYLAAPAVLLDGSVYKMYYAFTHGLGLAASPCDSAAQVQIGYATSTDGFFWVRSPSNPVVTLGGTGWDKSAPGLLTGSVVPVDGVDPESGLMVYYSTFTSSGLCVPFGIGRAVSQ